MSGHPQPLAFQHVSTYCQLILHQLYESPCVLSFDLLTMELVAWYWYVLCTLMKAIFILYIGLSMDTNWCRQVIYGIIVTIISSSGPLVCVLYFGPSRKTLSSRKQQYIYLYLGHMQASTLLSAKTVNVDSWVRYPFTQHIVIDMCRFPSLSVHRAKVYDDKHPSKSIPPQRSVSKFWEEGEYAHKWLRHIHGTSSSSISSMGITLWKDIEEDLCSSKLVIAYSDDVECELITIEQI